MLQDPEKLAGEISHICKFGQETRAIVLLNKLRERLRCATETAEAFAKEIGMIAEEFRPARPAGKKYPPGEMHGEMITFPIPI